MTKPHIFRLAGPRWYVGRSRISNPFRGGGGIVGSYANFEEAKEFAARFWRGEVH